MKPRGILLSLLLAFSFLLQAIPAVHAAVTIDSQCTASAASATSVTCTLSTVTNGDILVAIMEGAGVSPCSAFTNGMTTDGQSNSYTIGPNYCQSPAQGKMEVGIWFAKTTTTASNVGVSVAPVSGTATYVIQAYALTGTTNTQVNSVGSANPNSCSTCSTISDAVTSFTPNQDITLTGDLVFDDNAGETLTWTQPTSFTIYGCQPGNPSSSQRYIGCSSYDIANLGATTLSNSWASSPASSFLLSSMVAISFGSSAPLSTVVPCTFFQLQCWWYPLFFMGLYSGFILMVGTWLRTSPRGKSHLFLSAITFGSLIAVIFGIMNIVFPLLMLVLNTIIALRLRG